MVEEGREEVSRQSSARVPQAYRLGVIGIVAVTGALVNSIVLFTVARVTNVEWLNSFTIVLVAVSSVVFTVAGTLSSAYFGIRAIGKAKDVVKNDRRETLDALRQRTQRSGQLSKSPNAARQEAEEAADALWRAAAEAQEAAKVAVKNLRR